MVVDNDAAVFVYVIHNFSTNTKSLFTKQDIAHNYSRGSMYHPNVVSFVHNSSS